MIMWMLLYSMGGLNPQQERLNNIKDLPTCKILAEQVAVFNMNGQSIPIGAEIYQPLAKCVSMDGEVWERDPWDFKKWRKRP